MLSFREEWFIDLVLEIGTAGKYYRADSLIIELTPFVAS